MSLVASLKEMAFIGEIPILSHDEMLLCAEGQLSKSPLASMFETSYLDRNGMAVAPSIDATESQIIQDERVRRFNAAHGCIAPARNVIRSKFFVSNEDILNLICDSDAVPRHLQRTVAHGLSSFFNGDDISALYILSSMLEGILRHLLKNSGVDTTIYDSATGRHQERTITSLYDAKREDLNAAIGENLVNQIEMLFLKQAGPSLRHGVAHALLDDSTTSNPDSIFACWFIWSLCMRFHADHDTRETPPSEVEYSD